MKFEFSVSGYPGPSHHLALEKGVIRYSCLPGVEGTRKQLDIPIAGNKDWEAILVFLQNCQWKMCYEAGMVLDGTHWELYFQSGSFRLQSQGDNAYPPGYKKWLQLLNRLVGEEDSVY